MEDLRGESTDRAHQIMVKSAVDIGMETFRIWGGGMFFLQAFHDACDKCGALVHHDMQCALNANGPHGPDAASQTQEAEL